MNRNLKGQFIEVEKVKVECPNCGAETDMYPSDSNRGRKYCCYECAKEDGAFTGRNKERQLYECELCGSPFFDIKSKNRTYCSRDCANIINKHQHIPNNDKTVRSLRLRHSAEYRIWRKAIFEKDNHTCVECGETRGVMHAHHKISLSKDITRVFDLLNGETLCFDCHQEKHPNIRLQVGREWSVKNANY